MTDKCNDGGAVKLTPAQFSLLDRVCRTNGGGVSEYDVNGTQWRVVLRLYELGLVQGKKGAQWIAVHTKPGLELWRKAIAERKAKE